MNPALYKPSKWQSTFHGLKHNEALGAGSAGPGKSLCLLMDFVPQMVLEHRRTQLSRDHRHYVEPGFSLGHALHLRRTNKQLDQTIKRSRLMFPRIDPGAVFNKNDLQWTFSSGYTFSFGHCHDSGDWENYYSNEYTHIAFDELTQFEEEQYEQISSRCRSSDPLLRKMLKIRSCSNPMSLRGAGETYSIKNPFWVRDKFVKPHREGGKTFYKTIRLSDGSDARWSWIYLPAKLTDNPDPEFIRSYELQLRTRKPHIRKALLDGDWFVVAGAFFEEEWEPGYHICNPFRIPDHWPRWRSLDWGYKTRGVCHWYAMDDDDNVFVEREFSFQKKDIIEVGKRIIEIEKDARLWHKPTNRSLILGAADTQLWEKRGDVGLSKAEEHEAMGISWVAADKGSRARNAERITERLVSGRAPNGTYMSTPGLVFFSGCKSAIQTIPALPTDPLDPEAPLDGGDDHDFDSIGYGLGFASRGRAGIGGRRPIDATEEAEKERRSQWTWPDDGEGGMGDLGYGNPLC